MARRKTMPEGFPTWREDDYGKFRLLAYAEGYVMARRVGCAPFVVSEEKWLALGDVRTDDETNVVRLHPSDAGRREG